MFENSVIDQVWNKATAVEGFDSSQFRKDVCGAWIIKNQYGNRESIYGWEIDHIYPQSLGGDDDLDNLRAMQWENNLSKGDDYPIYQASVLSEGNKNIKKIAQFTVNKKIQMILDKKYK